MKTVKTKKKKPARPSGGFDAVKRMRDIRDKIDKDIEGMTFEEEKEYFSPSEAASEKKAHPGDSIMGKFLGISVSGSINQLNATR